jgi:hypothetical protein
MEWPENAFEPFAWTLNAWSGIAVASSNERHALSDGERNFGFPSCAVVVQVDVDGEGKMGVCRQCGGGVELLGGND